MINDPNIIVKTNNVKVDEIYLYDAENNKVLYNEIDINKNVYIQVERLKGFVPKDNEIFSGITLRVTGANGMVLMNEKDIVGDQSYPVEKFEHMVSPYFVVLGKDIKNPISCFCSVWDKQSSNSINIEFKVNVRNSEKIQ